MYTLSSNSVLPRTSARLQHMVDTEAGRYNNTSNSSASRQFIIYLLVSTCSIVNNAIHPSSGISSGLVAHFGRAHGKKRKDHNHYTNQSVTPSLILQ